MRSGGIGHAVILGMFGALPVPAFAQSNPTFSGSSGIPPQIIPLYARGGPTGSIEGDGGDTSFTSGGGDTRNATSSTGNSHVSGTASSCLIPGFDGAVLF